MLSPPFELSYLEVIQDRNSFFKTIAIIPTRNTNRQVMQQGMFTIQGDSMEPLEKELNGCFITEGILKKIEIPLDIVPDIKDYLFTNGINNFSIYPDLDGLSEIVNERLTPRKIIFEE